MINPSIPYRTNYQWLNTGATIRHGDAYVLQIVKSDGTTERTVIDVMRSENTFLPLLVR